MEYDLKAVTADLNLCGAIEDFADEKNISIDEARHILVNSSMYKMLYDFDTGLWCEGPDYLRDTYERSKNL